MDRLFQKIINLCFNRTFNFILCFVIVAIFAQEDISKFQNTNTDNINDKLAYNKEEGQEILHHINNKIKLMKYSTIKNKKRKKTITELHDNLKLSVKKMDAKNNEINSSEIILYITLDNTNKLTQLLINKKVGDFFLINGDVLFSSLTNLNTSKYKGMYKVTIMDIVNDNN